MHTRTCIRACTNNPSPKFLSISHSYFQPKKNYISIAKGVDEVWPSYSKSPRFLFQPSFNPLPSHTFSKNFGLSPERAAKNFVGLRFPFFKSSNSNLKFHRFNRIGFPISVFLEVSVKGPSCTISFTEKKLEYKFEGTINVGNEILLF